MISAFALALRQLPDPAFLGPLLKGLLAAVAVFLGLAGLAAWGLGTVAGGTGWLAGLAAAAGGLAALGLAIWLFVPVMIGLSGLFLNPVADAVERRFYPGLPPPAAGASLAAQARFNLVLGLKMGALALLVLPFGFLVPPLGAVLLWAISTMALGQGLFEGVAQRRMDVAAGRQVRRARHGAVLGAGAVLAALALVPGLNLLVPVLGTAVMTHLLHRP
jgi:CysZ protein